MPLETDALAALETARMSVVSRTEQARTAAKDARRLSEDVEAARATATSVGGEVTVRAAAGGAVDAIDLAPSALELDARALSRIVTETVRRAQREAAAAALGRMTETLGAESPLVVSTRARVEARFGSEARPS